ncbi:adenosine deaminase [Pseudoalteromonas sp. SW0106-04]|uniref:antiviral RADAR system adenosine deaminase RdrB n=1 Tax=Pseudoalteromonas sp. SW0106-04 TaxID=1702169 RepID=UPI0006B4551B|nr:antiviral RADAR system adenosine deaminase RdrB [Pseudoalteromonas sp. SW0106-04]GAP75183.1 adenosine deaminase [Pseudoalteromonas sp. SW0106-04]
MLNRQLSEHAAGCFYSDEQVAEHLWLSLLTPQDSGFGDAWQVLQDKCYQLLTAGVDARYPREFRLTDIRTIMGQQCHSGLFVSPSLPWLDELADNLLIRNGDLLHFKESKVQAYVRLAAELDPALLVGWRLANWLQQNPKPQAHDIRRVLNAQLPFFAPPANPVKPFAEGHVHVWGVTAESLIFSELLFHSKSPRKGNMNSDWEQLNDAEIDKLLTRARSLFAYFIDSTQQPHNKQIRAFSDWQNQRNTSYKIYTDWELLAQMPCHTNETNSQWLLAELAQAINQQQSNCWLWLKVFLSFIYQNNSTTPFIRSAILCFWQMMNALRRRLIMDGQGLSRFVERYNGNNLRKIGQPYKDNIRRLFVGKGDVAEIKSGSMAFSNKSIQTFSQALITSTSSIAPTPPYVFGEHEIIPNETCLRHIETLERWHFCGHFSRSKSAKRGKRPQADLKDNWKEAEKLLRRLRSQSGWNEATFLGGKLNPNFHFQPNRWFRGLDVAGDENALKIECFAPMLRWLRSGLHSKIETERANKDFHFSIHSGEDYAHPLSGMRHIDETVRFCEMRDGDRLGHALALGIEPLQWVQRQGEMILYADEHLDNLVWMWHYATVLSGRLPLAQQVIPLIERRIARFYNKVNWLKPPSFYCDSAQQSDTPLSEAQKDKLTPDILYRAWLLRRNCYYRWQKLHGSSPMTAMEQVALPDWESLKDDDKYASLIYKNRHSELRKDNSPVMVIVRVADEWESQSNIGLPPVQSQWEQNQDKHIIEDVDTPEELEFMAALQDYLLTQYDSMGIIIETNPTSNVYIARLKSHKEHPIFRWNPPDESVLLTGSEFNRFGLRKGPVKVLVNTDDPGIMPTTLRTEYMLLREAALDLGIGSTVAERWLESIRQFGIEQFHRNHLPVFEPI